MGGIPTFNQELTVGNHGKFCLSLHCQRDPVTYLFPLVQSQTFCLRGFGDVLLLLLQDPA
jgi:hypothetical protein